MQGVLLDTSVIIDVDRLDFGDLSSTPALISTVSVAELGFGLDVDDPVERAARMERFYALQGQFRILPFDLAAAKKYAVLASLVRQPLPDLQIAATAAANDLPLLTKNPEKFTGLERVLDVVGV